MAVEPKNFEGGENGIIAHSQHAQRKIRHQEKRGLISKGTHLPLGAEEPLADEPN
jgi:hypothetical protein